MTEPVSKSWQSLARSASQLLNLNLEPLDALIAFGERGSDVSGVDACGDMSGTVGVPGKYRKEHDPLGLSLVSDRHQSGGERLIAFRGAQLSPHLEPTPACVVDQEQMCFRVLFQVAQGDVLPIADVVDKTNGSFIEHAYEAPGAT